MRVSSNLAAILALFYFSLCVSAAFRGSGGKVIINGLSTTLEGFWKRHNVQAVAGALWDAPNNNYNGAISDANTLEYEFTVDQTGTYFIGLYSARVPAANPPNGFRNDEGNDVFVSIVAGSTNIVTPTKVFTHFGAANNELKWGDTFDKNHVKSKAKADLSTGTTYTLKIAGRSDGYFLRRITMNKGSISRDANSPQSSQGGSTPRPTTVAPPPPMNGNIFTLRKGNAMSHALDGGNGGANFQNVYLWQYNANNVNQHWVQISRGNGFFSFQKRNTNFCLDAGNGGANGQNLRIATCNANSQNQHWRKVAVGNNFRLEKRNSPGFSIDGNNGSGNSQNVYIWSSSNTNGNQQWRFTRV